VTLPQRTFTHSFKDVVTGSEILVDGITANPGGGLLTGTDSPGGGGGLFNSTTVLKPTGKQRTGRSQSTYQQHLHSTVHNEHQWSDVLSGSAKK